MGGYGAGMDGETTAVIDCSICGGVVWRNRAVEHNTWHQDMETTSRRSIRQRITWAAIGAVAGALAVYLGSLLG
jgi:hypothetical protein